MFIDVRNLQERRADRDSQFEGTRDIRNGYLFEVNGSVEGDREGMIWFKALDGNSEPFQVFYNGIIGDLRANMYVKIERNPKDPARWQVSEFDTGIYFNDQSTYEQLPSLSAIPAKADYEWPPGFPGAKALNIFPRAITDFAVRPTSPASMKARVYSGIYPGATNYARFQGPVNTKDFTADVPGAGLARLAAISIDNTGTLNYTNGTTFVDGLPMPDASLPAVPASQMLISAIRLVNGMTAIEESNFDLEMRPLMANGTVNVKVSEVWESDFGAAALQTDASGNVTINGTGTLTIPTDLIHAGDITTKIGFTAGVQTFSVVGVDMLTLTNAAQDLITLGPGSGDVDINFNGDMFLRGSDGFVGIGTAAPGHELEIAGSAELSGFLGIGVSPTRDIHVKKSNSSGIGLALELDNTSVATNSYSALTFKGDNGTVIVSFFADGLGGVVSGGGGVFRTFSNHPLAFGTNATERMRITAAGLIGINGVTAPSTELDIGDGAINVLEVTAPAAGAANSVRIYAEDNGAGKTRLMAIFNTGAAQQVAIQP